MKKGTIHTQEARAKMSAAMTPERRAKTVAANHSREVSPETRAKIGAAHRGLKASLETRLKMSAVRRGRKFSPEHRAKISWARWGHEVSPETRAKISLAREGRFGGENHPNWKGGTITNSSGYVQLFRPDHPFADKHSHIFEHRLVMECILGRYLTSGETVHHRNGVRDDNRPENLEIVVTKGPHYGGVICPRCQMHFLIR